VVFYADSATFGHGTDKRARSRLGGSCASHSMQLLALVIAAAMGCFISCAKEVAISPNRLRLPLV
jgi:hypothetical protein